MGKIIKTEKYYDMEDCDWRGYPKEKVREIEVEATEEAEVEVEEEEEAAEKAEDAVEEEEVVEEIVEKGESKAEPVHDNLVEKANKPTNIYEALGRNPDGTRKL